MIARVGEDAIGADEVRAVMARDDLGAQEALDALIAQVVLAREAERAGVAAPDDYRNRERQGAVRALLRALDEEALQASPTDAEIEAAYESSGESRPLFVVREDIRRHLIEQGRTTAVVGALESARGRSEVTTDVPRLEAWSGLDARRAP